MPPAASAIQAAIAARPAPPCLNACSPRTAPAPSRMQAWCVRDPQSVPTNHPGWVTSMMSVMLAPCRCCRVSRATPRCLPVPVLALGAQTLHWASTAAEPPGHKSYVGARGTRGGGVAPGGLPAPCPSARSVGNGTGAGLVPARWRAANGRPSGDRAPFGRDRVAPTTPEQTLFKGKDGARPIPSTVLGLPRYGPSCRPSRTGCHP